MAVTVNLSGTTIVDPGLPKRVQALLDGLDLDPGRLIVELTEREEVQDVVAAQAVLGELAALGVRSALDDWGTAYSSLAYLDALPVAFLKLDRLLLERSGHSPSTMQLIAGTIALAHSVDVKVVIEGIETPEQLQVVQDFGADYGQGFLLGRPEPFDAVRRRFSEIAHALPS